MWVLFMFCIGGCLFAPCAQTEGYGTMLCQINCLASAVASRAGKTSSRHELHAYVDALLSSQLISTCVLQGTGNNCLEL